MDLFASDLKKGPQRGRGAVSNAVGRFEAHQRDRVEDGWSPPEDQPLRTEVLIDHAKRVITRNTSPDIPFDRSINPYKGCEHGCTYCFARPTHAYLGLSPGLDFETRIFAKPDAHELLEAELRQPGYEVAPIAIGTNTDPYQPIEQQQEIMRRCLLVLEEYHHPVSIVTKGALIQRDLDILGRMARKNLVKVAISITTLNNHLSRAMEPRAASPTARLRVVNALSKAGIPVGVMAAPMIPALNDHELEPILEAAQRNGADFARYITLRLPMEVSGLFEEWLRATYPKRAKRVLRYVRELHGGQDYDPSWGKRMTGQGVYANLIARRYRVAVKRLGLDAALKPLDCARFQVPERPGDQLTLF